MRDLTEFDRAVVERHGPHVVGVDEVGMGPLAGPICACAYLLRDLDDATKIAIKDRQRMIEVNDSKKLSHQDRERLQPGLVTAGWHALGWVEPAEIDEIHSLERAGALARERAFEGLFRMFQIKPSAVVVDFYPLNTGKCQVPVISITNGDARSFFVAVASIVAKVARDRVLAAAADRYPGFESWKRNAGYGVPEHRDAIRAMGMTPYHRRYVIEAALRRDAKASWLRPRQQGHAQS